MKHHPRIAALLALAFALSGCAVLPGFSFDARLPNGPRLPSGEMRVEAVTPDLLAAQENMRAQSAGPHPNPSLDQAITQYVYRVAPGDVLSVVVWGDPVQTSAFRPQGNGSLAVTTGQSIAPSTAPGFKVNADGTFYYPYVGRIAARGKTTEEIRDRLTALMRPYIRNPQVTVDVAQFGGKKYELSGAVARPGLYPLDDTPLTVSQAITAAGGVVRQVPSSLTSGNAIPRALGDLSRVLYIHEGASAVLDLRSLYRNGDASQDRLLQAGDIVEVPDNSREQVHVIGEVANPGNYQLDNGTLNLSEVLGDAGGFKLETANPARVFVFRGSYREQKVFWLDARSPDAMLLANRFMLEPQDVVYVAATGLADWNRIVTQILPTVQTLYETKVMVNR